MGAGGGPCWLQLPVLQGGISNGAETKAELQDLPWLKISQGHRRKLLQPQHKFLQADKCQEWPYLPNIPQKQTHRHNCVTTGAQEPQEKTMMGSWGDSGALPEDREKGELALVSLAQQGHVRRRTSRVQAGGLHHCRSPRSSV